MGTATKRRWEAFAAMETALQKYREEQERKNAEAEKRAATEKRNREIALLAKLMNKYNIPLPEWLQKEAEA